MFLQISLVRLVMFVYNRIDVSGGSHKCINCKPKVCGGCYDMSFHGTVIVTVKDIIIKSNFGS